MNAMDEPRTHRRARPEEIQQDIERTRSKLGETAGTLAHKLDPKAQARQRLRAGRNACRKRPITVLGVAAGVAALVVATVMWRRNG